MFFSPILSHTLSLLLTNFIFFFLQLTIQAMYYKFYKPLQKQNQPQFFTSHGRNKKEETKMETVQNFILKDDEKKLKEWISEQPQEDLLLANENSVVISAVHFSSKRCLRVLAEAGFDLDYTNGWTPSALSLAMEFGDEESGRILLNHGAKLDSVDSWSRTNIISHDNIECLKLLAEFGMDLTERLCAISPFTLASERRAKKCLTFLVNVLPLSYMMTTTEEEEAQINALLKNFDDATVEEISRLPGFHNHINNTNRFGLTFLHLLMKTETARGEQHKKLKMIQRIVTSGAEVNRQDNYGNTPLHYAQDVRSAQLLINFGADMKKTNNDGERPADHNPQWSWTGESKHWFSAQAEKDTNGETTMENVDEEER